MYNVQIGEDAHDVPIYKCLRGMSALEGYHQKNWQLIRGYNILPHLARALLVRVLGLPRRYSNYYDGWVIEKEIEGTWDWDLEQPPHSHIECTKHFAETGEEFGIPSIDPSNDALGEEIASVVEAMEDGAWTTALEEDEDNNQPSSHKAQELPASAMWLMATTGCKRGQGPVSTPTEKAFFLDHSSNFQSSNGQEEADNYSSIRWGAFTSFINSRINQEDSGQHEVVTDMIYKTAYQLQAYYKQMKQQGNIVATIHHVVSTQNKEM
jgi:hypothetical protein